MPEAGSASLASTPHAPARGLSSADEARFDSLLEGEKTEAPAASQSSQSPGVASPSPTVPRGDLQALEAAPSWHDFMSGWQAGLYQDPVLCGVLAGMGLGLLGVFIVLRRAVFVTAAVSQSAALGVALAFFLQIHLGLNIPPIVSAFALAALAGGLLAIRAERFRLPRETLIAFAYLGASALAVLVGDRITQEAHDVAAILFGTAVLVRREDLYAVLAGGLLTGVAVLAFYRALVFSGFDPEGARVQKVPVSFIELLLWVLVALEVSVTTRALGALPVFAFAVMPAMGALGVAHRLRSALAIAAGLGAAAGGLGYLCAFFFRFPVGASQATVATAFFLVCVAAARIFAPRRTA